MFIEEEEVVYKYNRLNLEINKQIKYFYGSVI